MKKQILSFILLCIVGFASAQNEKQLERERLYNEYKIFKDTMTTRTWINMVNLSDKLEAIVSYDNTLIDSLWVKRPGEADQESRIQELSKLREELVINNARLNEAFSRAENAKKNLLIATIVIGVLFLSLLISFLLIYSKYRKLMAENENSSQNVLKLKNQHKQEIDALKDKIELFAGEKEMLENNAQEMRKSLEIIKSEQYRKKEDHSQTSNNEIEEVRKEMEELSNEITRLIEERDEFEEALGMANLKLAHQIDRNKKFEADLESLLGRLKTKPKEDED